jgi:hypothetical protein
MRTTHIKDSIIGSSKKGGIRKANRSALDATLGISLRDATGYTHKEKRPCTTYGQI